MPVVIHGGLKSACPNVWDEHKWKYPGETCQCTKIKQILTKSHQVLLSTLCFRLTTQCGAHVKMSVHQNDEH